MIDIAKNCRYYSPQFSPKDVPAFYDLSGVTENAAVFQKIMDVFIARYKAQMAAGNGPTVIVGYDARGFVVGPPIALALGIPFVLLRKAGKNPGPLVESSAYSKEYAEHQPDKMCVRLGAIIPGDRVVLIDDLIATGGTVPDFAFKIMNFAFKMMDFVFQMMNFGRPCPVSSCVTHWGLPCDFLFKMMDFAFKMMDFPLKMMIQNAEFLEPKGARVRSNDRTARSRARIPRPAPSSDLD